ncbi:MAG: DUF1028 domain-containing protein [Ignavibacteria bacterium]|nr:DUF1028 domain-containing protein [Ignavibacteria bacterium]
MKTLFIGLVSIILLVNNFYSQDTFSITAVDPVTGYVGSAGASCVAGSIILSDVHPNRGVIHTQAYYLSSNQVYARNLMNQGLSPQQIIDSLVLHDAQNNPTIRQYGITDFIGNTVRTAGYTGVNCTNYKNHVWDLLSLFREIYYWGSKYLTQCTADLLILRVHLNRN